MAFIQFKKCLNDPKQLLKLVILLICVCITIYQLSQCVRKLVYPPVSTHYRFDVNESMKYPDVTICRNPPYKTALFPNYNLKTTTKISGGQFPTLFPFANKRIDEFLPDVTYTRPEIFLWYSVIGVVSENMLQDAIRFEETYLLHKGRCHTIKPNITATEFSPSNGYQLYLLHAAKAVNSGAYTKLEGGFDVYLHNNHEFPLGDDNEEMSFIDQLRIDPSEDLTVSITTEHFNKQSSSKQPCNASIGYSQSACQDRCVHNAIARKVGCTLPWLRNLEKSYRQCGTPEETSELIKMVANRKSYLCNCTCPIACNITLFHSTVRSRKDRPTSKQVLSTLTIYYSSNIVKTVSEVVTYDWNSFLSEIGGSLGFLLGLSVIGIISVIEEIVRSIFGKKTDGGKRDSLTGSERTEVADDGSKSDGDLRNFLDYLAERQENGDNKKY